NIIPDLYYYELLLILILKNVSITSRYTIFPYTTLFRSKIRTPPQSPLTSGSKFGLEKLPAAISALVISSATEVKIIGVVAVPSADRKSTRLNSSHVKISYAVFCLKKKIINK